MEKPHHAPPHQPPIQPSSPSTNPPPLHHRLRLISVNDVYSFDDTDTTPPRGGWSRATTLIKKLAVETPDRSVLITANGDVLGGSCLLQHSRGRVAVEVMNSVPVDVAVLGNHEFDYGDQLLMERVQESTFSWLGSNVYYPIPENSDSILDSSLPDGFGYFPGIHGDGMIYNLSTNLKLGVFGLVTKQTPKISFPSAKVIFDSDVVSVARRTCDRLRFRGAHVIVAITHMSEAEDLLVASDTVARVDLILGGHEHEPLSVMVHRDEDAHAEEDDFDTNECRLLRQNEGGVLVFKCGMNANWVGTVDIDIEYFESQSKYGVDMTNVISISTSWAMHAVTSQTPNDQQVSQIVQQFREETDQLMLVTLFGEDTGSLLKLDDILATIGSRNEESCTTLPLDTRMTSVRRRESTGGNFIADAMLWHLETNCRRNLSTALPMLAMINGGFIRADRLYRPRSDFTVRHLLKELPFPQLMIVLEMKGRYLKEAMAQQLRGSSRGPTGSYPHLSHNSRLRYRMSPSIENESDEEVPTVDSFTVDGIEVSNHEKYLIAVTEFVADGSEGCSSWLNSNRISNVAWNIQMSSVVLQYLQEHSVVLPKLEGRVVKLDSMEGTTIDR